MILDLDEVLMIHELLILKFGGTSGIRDQGLLESSLVRPLQTYDGHELYPSPVDKAAALLESIVINHPFFDGNKRLGYVLMRLVLLESGKDFEASQEEKYQLVIKIANGKLNFSDVTNWIKERLK